METEKGHHGAHPHGGEISGTRLVITIALNLLITVFQIIGGILSNSLALISDSFHNLSDALAVLISYLALRIGKKDRDLKRTYGYKRAEILAALLNASIMVAISFFLFREAIRRIFNPEPVESSLMLIVASIGLAADFTAVVLLHRDSRKSLNVRSAYLHLIADTLSSVVVIASGVIIHFFRIYILDPIATMLIAVYVLRESWTILRESVAILMQSVPPGIDIMAIKTRVESLPGVDNLHDVHIWKISADDVYFEGHIDVTTDMKISRFDLLRTEVEAILHDEFHIEHTTIQVEFKCCTDQDVIRREQYKPLNPDSH